MKNILKRHQNTYKFIQKQDLIKLLYQSEFGPGHMITDFEKTSTYLSKELEICDNQANCPLYEDISSDLVRVNLKAYKTLKLPENWLCNAFAETAQVILGQHHSFENKLILLDHLLEENYLDKTNIEDLDFEFTGDLHHSKIYSEHYHPHYRVISRNFIDLNFKTYQLYLYILKLLRDKQSIIISLEGRCASGKTTLINNLKKFLDITVISADDFFLPVNKKTPKRLLETGGNINYEALEATLNSLEFHKRLKYQVFNCSKQQYFTKTIEKVSNIVIVEGVYSYHPRLKKFYDGLAYITVDKQEQLRRLETRSKSLLKRFIDEFIPLEENYYQQENFYLKADIVI